MEIWTWENNGHISEIGGLWRGDIMKFYCNLSLTGMGKELENLILENTELLATK